MQFIDLQKKILMLSVIVFFCSMANAEGDSSPSLNPQPFVKTTFPTFLGIGVQSYFFSQMSISLEYGFVPQPFYETIGTVAAALSGNSSYKDVVEAALSNNSLWRIDARYHFYKSGNDGWFIGLSYSYINSKGQAEIDSVLSAATGYDYTTLKNLLIAAGKSTSVDLDSQLSLLDAYTGYNWNMSTHTLLALHFGITKIISSDVKMKTGLSTFESTSAGKKLIANSETEIERIVLEYGLSPIVGVQYNYLF
ncbi:MAG: hypothetical protein KDD50_12515 [Bdellovibrionales bacterium]|nr:hypothetical protein [Bdellovibrionales bacterium]